jgi:hypothetical protein
VTKKDRLWLKREAAVWAWRVPNAIARRNLHAGSGFGWSVKLQVVKNAASIAF